ncbi:hypothetical protein [Streptomyces sp. NPDC088736]|jgi:hypothetical protein|uniref:hypothetical protein n=1 Tax=Streptomyces sp. NPDC088736 TaxID=3365881 RepID=UPI0037F88C68
MSAEELAEQADKSEPEKGRWSQAEQLLALVADRVAGLAYLYASANTESKSKRPKVPEPIRRPGAQLAKPKQKITDAQAETLWSMLNGGAA